MTEEMVKEYVLSLPARIFRVQSYKSLDCTKLEKGLHHLNFKLVISDGTKTCQAVVRLPAMAEDHQALIHEAWYLERLPNGVAPRILFHADTSLLGTPILITEFAPGVHIPFSRLDDSQIVMLANRLVAVHAIKSDRYSPLGVVLPYAMGTYRDYARLTVFEDIDKRYKQAGSLPHDSKTVLRARKLLDQRLGAEDESWSQNEFSLCHGDIGIYNVLWTDRELSLIDWDGARFGDPADDIAYIFAINNVTADWQNIFLDAYISKSARTDILERVEAYLLKNYLFDVVWALGKLLEEQEDRSLVKLAHGEYWAMYETRLTALRQYLHSE
jgi:aminoglycoside phosphotransferase (APT) family kinase protein